MPLLGEHDMDEVCARVLTSGSTGAPKPVGLTYGNFLWSAVGSAFNIGVEPSDRWLCCLPLSHISGLSDRHALGHLRHHRGRPRAASTSTASRAALEATRSPSSRSSRRC